MAITVSLVFSEGSESWLVLSDKLFQQCVSLLKGDAGNLECMFTFVFSHCGTILQPQYLSQKTQGQVRVMKWHKRTITGKAVRSTLDLQYGFWHSSWVSPLENYLFSFCVSVVYLHLCMCTVCAWFWEVRRGYWIPGTGVTGCAPPSRC